MYFTCKGAKVKDKEAIVKAQITDMKINRI